MWLTLRDWIAARAPGPLKDEPDAISLEVLPGDRIMAPAETQQLLVRAHYADGRVRDVTWLTQFFSNDETTVSVKPSGLVKAAHEVEKPECEFIFKDWWRSLVLRCHFLML